MTSNNIPSGSPINVGNTLSKQRRVSNEEGLRGHAHVELHDAVTDVLELLGFKGMFIIVSDGGNVALVGDPDFAWIDEGQPITHPKLMVEYKTDWEADLKDLIHIFSKSSRNVNENQGIEAIEQLYGYMTFNNIRYGILTNWTRAWCLHRVEEGDHKAFVGMTLLAERDASPTPCAAPSDRTFGTSAPALKQQKQAIADAGYYDVAPTQGTYPCLDLDLRLCDFQVVTAHHSELACVVHTNLLQDALGKTPLPSICKVFDIARNPRRRSALEDEARAYASLLHLQGKVIPKLYGYYNIWGFLHILALEPVGVAISEDIMISAKLRKRMQKALGKIHSTGYLHGDIARRNFCQRGEKVFMVDLELSRQTSSDVEQAVEMALIDSL